MSIRAKKYLLFIILGSFILYLGYTSYLHQLETSEIQQTIQDTGKQIVSEGDVLEGKSRVEIEKEYKKQLKLSDVRADEYASSLVGEKVTWVAQVVNVKDAFLEEGYEIETTMNGYTVTVRDSNKEFGDLVKGDPIIIKAEIDILNEFLGGINIYLKDATIEKL